jgi:hypothetical protein
MALTVDARSRWPVPSTPAMIRIAGVGAALGIALSLTDYVDYGRWVTGAGVLLLLVSLHRFGRSGADEPIRFELPPPRKKRKKKRPATSDANADRGDSEGAG